MPASCRLSRRNLACACEPIERRLMLAITANFNPTSGLLSINGDALANIITISRNAGGNILVNGGAVSILGGIPTVATTSSISVFSLDGNDTVTLDETNGGLPPATIQGGSGNDVLTGGSGNDLLFGTSGLDTLNGKGGIDFLDGGDDADTLTGGDANDNVYGQAGADTLIWNPGDDTDLNEGGADVDTVLVNGGNGAETFTVTANGTRVRFDRIDPAPFFLDINAVENLTLNCNGGDDVASCTGNLAGLILLTFDGGIGNDSLAGSNAADTLLGNDGNDTLVGFAGNDSVVGGLNNDTIVWNPGDGSDTFEGGADLDTFNFNGSASNEALTLTANAGRLVLNRNIAAVTLNINDVEIANLQLLGGLDTVAAGDLSTTDLTLLNVDLGTNDSAADSVTISGTEGPDSLLATASGTSATVLGVAAQINLLHIEGANDTLIVAGLGGNDLLNAAAIVPGVVRVILDGGANNDTLTGSSGPDTLLGGIGDDCMTGSSGADVLLGAADNDTLIGGADNDNVGGEGGNDRIIWNVGDGVDTAAGGPETDTVEVNGDPAAENYTIAASAGTVTVTRTTPITGSIAMTSVESLRVNANAGNDTVTAGAGLDGLVALTLDGGADIDSLTGGDGTDTLIGSTGSDILEGGANDDAFLWNLGDGTDIVDGNLGSDTLQFNTSNAADSIILDSVGVRVLLHAAFGILDLGGIDVITLQTLGGADNVTVNDLSTTDVTRLNVDLALLTGDGAQDTLTLNGSLKANSIAFVHNTDGLDVINVNTDGVGQANLSFEQTTIAGALSIGSGGVARIAANGSRVLDVQTLTLTGTAKLDLTNNSLIVDYLAAAPNPVNTLRTALRNGFANGTWTGPGIVSSNAVTDNRTGIGWARSTDLFTTFPQTWKGLSVDSSAVLFTHTVKADANLDRVANFEDLLRLAQRYGLAGDWVTGDFNYDAVVGFDDLLALAQTYNVSIVVASPETVRATRRVSTDVLA